MKDVWSLMYTRTPGPEGRLQFHWFGSLLLASPVAYWAWSHTGLYRWVVELQLEHLGQYWPVLSFIVCLLAVMAPFYALGHRVYRPEQQASMPDATAAPARMSPWSPENHGSLGVALGGVLLLVVGGRDLVGGLTEGPPSKVDVAQLEKLGLAEALYIDVSGRPMPEAAIGIQEDRSTDAHIYVPLLATNADPAAGPVQVSVLLQARESYFAAQPEDYFVRASFQGVARAEKLPNLVLEGLRSAGITAATLPVVIQLDESVSEQLAKARFFAGFGLLLLLVAAGSILYRMRKASRA